MSVFNTEVAGATNFIGDVDIDGDVDVDGDLTADNFTSGGLSLVGLSTDLTAQALAIDATDQLVKNTNIRIIDQNLNTTNDVAFASVSTPAIDNSGSVVKINDDTVFTTQSVKLTTVAGQDSITQPGCLHLQSQDNTCIFLEADTNWSGVSDVPYIMFSQDGNHTAMNITGANNIYSIIASSTTAPGLDLSIGVTADNGIGVVPTINSIVPKIQIRSTSTLFKQDSNMSNNNIINTSDVELESITANTTNIVMNSDIDMSNNDIINLANINTGGNLAIGSNILMGTNNISNVGDLSINGMLKNIGAPNIQVGDDLDMLTNNIEDLGLLNFATTPATDNANTNILTIEAGGNVEIRTVASLPAVNPFDQDLNIADDVQFARVYITDPLEAGIFIEANNNDNVGNETPYLSLQGSGTGGKLYGMEINYDTSGSDRRVNFVSGVHSATLLEGFQFWTTELMTDNSPLRPTIPLTNLKFEIGGVTNISYQDFQVTSGNSLILPSIVSDTSNDYLVIDSGDNAVKKRTIVFGNNYATVQSLGESTTVSTGYSVKTSMTTPTVPAGDYKIEWSCEITSSDVNERAYSRVNLDSGTILAEVKVGPILVASDYQPCSGSMIRTLTNATHLIEFEYRSSVGSATAKIRNASIIFHRVA